MLQAQNGIEALIPVNMAG